MGIEKNYGYSYGVTGIKVSHKKSIVKKKKKKKEIYCILRKFKSK